MQKISHNERINTVGIFARQRVIWKCLGSMTKMQNYRINYYKLIYMTICSNTAYGSSKWIFVAQMLIQSIQMVLLDLLKPKQFCRNKKLPIFSSSRSWLESKAKRESRCSTTRAAAEIKLRQKEAAKIGLAC